MKNFIADGSKEDVFSNIANALVMAGFDKAFIEVNDDLTEEEFKKSCDLIVHIAKSLADFVNMISFRKKSILLLLDPIFNLNSITAFKNKDKWVEYIDNDNYLKGFMRKTDTDDVIHITKPVIWCREAKA
jgi:hypothetical protein